MRQLAFEKDAAYAEYCFFVIMRYFGRTFGPAVPFSEALIASSPRYPLSLLETAAALCWIDPAGGKRGV